MYALPKGGILSLCRCRFRFSPLDFHVTSGFKIVAKGDPLSQSSLVGRYRARAFAELAGVTVRTLHHYDRLGLLRAKRSSSGYRLYQADDLERLERIAALKFLGL